MQKSSIKCQQTQEHVKEIIRLGQVVLNLGCKDGSTHATARQWNEGKILRVISTDAEKASGGTISF